MPLNRRRLLQSVTGLFAGCFSSLGWAAEPKALAFVATGDWGQEGDTRQKAVATQMGIAARRMNSSFVVAVGDNFYDAGVTSTSDAHWKVSFEDIYTDPALQTPWYAILGNHDYGGSPQAQIDYSGKSRRWMMPARYYVKSVTLPGGMAADLFFIDTSPLISGYRNSARESNLRANVLGQDGKAQLAWLQAALAKSTAPWKLVFGHHPVFSGGEHGDTSDLVRDLKPLLDRYGVQAYVNGHDHDLQHIDRDGIAYVCTGAGASVRTVKSVTGTRFARSQVGFTAYRLTPDRLTIDFIDDRGVLMHSADVPRVRA
ncbi:metallophosphoesterase [soil metagenome]